jgi:hypothetical protein
MNNKTDQLVIERRSMTLKHLIELVRAENASLINILGTPVVELRDHHATRRIIVSNIVFERDRVKEKQSDGREKIYLVSPLKLLRSACSGSP